MEPMDRSRSRSSEEAILLEDAVQQGFDQSSQQGNGPGHPHTDGSDVWLDTPRDSSSLRERGLPDHHAGDRGMLSHSDRWQHYQRFLPKAIGRGISALLNRIEGPRSPRPFKISPLCSSLAPVWRHSPRMRRFGSPAMLISSALYFVAFVTVLVLGTSNCHIEGHGVPLRLSCTDRLWFVKSTLLLGYI
jgi:hypothetical protein